MIEVLEGEGTEESLSRLVRYFYEEQNDLMVCIGKNDPVSSLLASATEKMICLP